MRGLRCEGCAQLRMGRCAGARAVHGNLVIPFHIVFLLGFLRVPCRRTTAFEVRAAVRQSATLSISRRRLGG
jgi:hypothetical protein